MHKLPPEGASAARRSVAANHTGSGGRRRRSRRRRRLEVRGNIGSKAELKVAGLFPCTKKWSKMFSDLLD